MAPGERPALDRILRQPGMRQAFRLLTEDISGADLTSFLLEVFRRRTEELTPADVLRRHRRDRFARPSPVAFESLRRVEDACLACLPEAVEVLTLSPLVPSGTHSAVTLVDQNNVVSTIRGTEVAADPTNGLALIAADRRKASLVRDPRSDEVVRLASFQRVVRAQRFSGDLSFAHFELFGQVTAGRAGGDYAFERTGATEHLRTIVGAISDLGASRIRVELTDFTGGRFEGVVEHLSGALATERIEVIERPDRPSGDGYYDGFCFKVTQTPRGGESIEVADGGFTDWTRTLVGSEKERLVISGVGLDRLALSSSVARGAGR